MSKRGLFRAIQNLLEPMRKLFYTSPRNRYRKREVAEAVQNLPKPVRKLFHLISDKKHRKLDRSQVNLVKAVRNLFKPTRKLSRSGGTKTKKQQTWMLRNLMLRGRQPGLASSGFVLPTVVMVILVVILLTTAIVFRSFDRSKNASNFRVNQAVLSAATPAIDRARAKLDELFADPTLPRAVPSDATLYNTLVQKIGVYTFGDETPVTLAVPGSPATTGGTTSVTSKTAWKFPVDTDNNGKFDSFALYGIYFNSPPITAGQNRARNPLEARTPPMIEDGRTNRACPGANTTSASLVGNSGWYKIKDKLKKSFFAFTAIVPISDPSASGNYEPYKSNKGFSALEFQQDRTQIPLTNNAVVYEDDLDITPGPTFNLNGRIFTNSNLLTAQTFQPIRFYQVSSQDSCYYDPDNGKIIVGGNVVGNGPIATNNVGGVGIDLFGDSGITASGLGGGDVSASNAPNQVAYNSQAYAQRIGLLVNAQLQPNTAVPATDRNYGLPTTAPSTDPTEVQDNIRRRQNDDPSLDFNKLRQEEVEIYFRKRTRRVPFTEVAYGNTTGATAGYTQSSVLQGSGDTLRPPQAWIDPPGSVALNPRELPATDPADLGPPQEESRLGDRILVGNNLPQLRWDPNQNKFLGEDTPQTVTGQKWDSTRGNNDRTRTTRVNQLADLGVIDRDGFWEKSAAAPQNNILDPVGGLRVVTGAGIYQRNGSFLTTRPPVNASGFTVVWPDTMPTSNSPNVAFPNGQRSDLVMRATAVYHYRLNSYNPNSPTAYQTPIACISSYYDPTDRDTARNRVALADVSGELVDANNTAVPRNNAKARSDNGISYGVPSTTALNIGAGVGPNASGLFTAPAAAATVEGNAAQGSSLRDRLSNQANLVFPNGRSVNPQLRQALTHLDAGRNLTLAEQSAIDSTICALQIADGTLTPTPSPIPDGAIKEVAFLDARQVKAIDKDQNNSPQIPPSPPPTYSPGTYDLEIEQRQPLEIRATVLDLGPNGFYRRTIGAASSTQEYLIPNSGVIYASRDDASSDQSNTSSANVSATDFILDSERRPNGIMLVNGQDLSRTSNYRPEEKGFILATNLPTYIQGNFNLHTNEEFTGPHIVLAPSPAPWNTANFYTSRTASNLDPNFACRPGDPRLPNCATGETWRPASIIADSVTLLSSNFRAGFRNEGDYDLRNNQGNVNAAVVNRLQQGFWDNNFVTSAVSINTPNSNIVDTYYSSTPASNNPRLNSSYLNNFVTPIQRRSALNQFPEYVMEVCRTLPVSDCSSPSNWVVGYTSNPNANSWTVPPGTPRNQLAAGTTAMPALSAADQRYARRVAFMRNSDGTLVTPPVPLRIHGGNFSSNPNDAPDQPANALWFATTSNNTDPPSSGSSRYDGSGSLFYSYPPNRTPQSQPLLEPVLQFQVTTATPNGNNYFSLATASSFVKQTNWLPQASPTTFNLAMAAGDTPVRVGAFPNGTPVYERNGGLHNFVRFLENWDTIPSYINGSFIQFKRSLFATAPFQVFPKSGPTNPATSNGLFDTTSPTRQGVRYQSDSTPQPTTGEAPFYMPPTRNWGFDVALLSQNPDLFAQRFVEPPTDSPNEYFREVGRDDKWIQTLLCAAQDNSASSLGYDTPTSDYGNNMKYAIPAAERPATCPVP